MSVFYCCEKVYPYEYMDDWEKLNETSLPEKENFYSHLNMEDTTDADYELVKKVCKNFEIKNLEEHHDLYVQSDTLFLADVFENFRSICREIYELDPAKFLSGSGLAWQVALKMAAFPLLVMQQISSIIL